MEHNTVTNALTWAAILSVIISAIISGVVAYFVHKKLVSHAFAALKDLEKDRKEYEARQKAQIVAELSALWLFSGSDSPSADQRRRLNELSFQCALWLPLDIHSDLSARLTNSAGARNIKEILADVRVHLGNLAIDPTSIVHF